MYEHVRADTGAVFYVGKGSGNRARIANKHHRSRFWMRTRDSAGGFSIRYVAVGLEEELAFLIEVERIAQLKARGVQLCNMTDGGDGVSGIERTPEWSKKIGDAHRGKTVSLETRKKLSDHMKLNPMVYTEEMRKAQSEFMTGKQMSLGYKQTEEWKRAKSVSMIGNKSRTGQKRSEAEKRKASESLSGRIQGIIRCDACGKEGGNAMRRWHFDNCRVGVVSCK